MNKNIEIAKECGAWYAPTTDNITFPSRKELDVYTAKAVEELQQRIKDLTLSTDASFLTVEELQRQNAMLVDTLKKIIAEPNESFSDSKALCEIIRLAKKAVKATSVQSAAWLEASHIEWMKGLEPAAHMYPSDLKRFQEQETFAHAFSVAVGRPDEKSIPIYAIPAKKD